MSPLDTRVEATLTAGAAALLGHGMPGAVLGLRTIEGQAIGCAGSALSPSTAAAPAAAPPDAALAAWPSSAAAAPAAAPPDAALAAWPSSTAAASTATTALTPGTAFDIASITKVLATTTSIIRLVSAGRLALDDRIERYLPAFSGGAKSAVTVRDLLAHRGGLQPWHPLYLAAAVSDGARADPLGFALALPLAARPRSARIYSDLGFMMLGRVIEVVTGEPLTAAVSALVLEPLGLNGTAYAHPVAGSGAVADTGAVAASAQGDAVERRMVDTGEPYPVPYAVSDFAGWRDRLLVGEVNDGNAFHAFGGVSGHAGLFSTPADLLAFGAALSDHRSRDDLWNPLVVDEFFTASADPAQALGFRRYRIDLGGGTVTALGHPGFTGVAVGFVPDASLSFVIATNRLLSPQPPANDRLWQEALPVLRDALATTPDPARPSASRE
ncbi:serine hydrolase domain-containing protein [Herbiconiux sp. P17]|uniref:serine hydrolase domain-containing protein n=1 Tax=Herbiconiux wuyangfengii TaxID=3342794 RepID=UPI0035BAC415